MQLTEIKGIGDKTAEKLSRLGLTKLRDLLVFFPHSYEDRRRAYQFSEILKERKKVPVEALVVRHEHFYSHGKRILKVIISDGTMQASLVCLNRPFLEQQLKIDASYLILGNFDYKYNSLSTASFEILSKDSPDYHLNFGRIVPIYPLVEGLKQKQLRRLTRMALDHYLPDLKENLPKGILSLRKLMNRAMAIEMIHFPITMEQLKEARRRLSYYEFFQFHLSLQQQRLNLEDNLRPPYLYSEEIGKFISHLEFRLTSDQEKALQEIETDLLKSKPMRRLLQGDVGSGKTVVAAAAMCRAIENDRQCLLLVPTEILANQHFQNFKKWFPDMERNFGIELLTGSTKAQERNRIIENLVTGKCKIIIGTHALFSEEIQIPKLGFIVIDEQHKFGVSQRDAVIQKGKHPDVLIMTATPIPRTLGLLLYGNLDSSIIKERPYENLTKTFLLSETLINTAYQKVIEEVKLGHQAMIVYPIIETSTKIDLKPATQMFNHLKSSIFKGFNLALCHGQMNSLDRDNLIRDFVAKKFDILITTTIIEVGIDIPNVTVLVIEEAQQYGLSQLHQLRGRIGRHGKPSYCFTLYSDTISENSLRRLQVFNESYDGFYLAEEDLKMRGPGEFLGSRQSGLLEFKIADIQRDFDLLTIAKEDALKVLSIQKP